MAKKKYQHAEEKPAQVQEPAVAYLPTLNTVGLNPAQLHLLKMLSFAKTDKVLTELKQLISEFYLKQLNEQMDKYWEEGRISDNLLNEHLRAPYK